MWENRGSVLVSDSTTDAILTIPIRPGASQLWASFTNSADAILDAFQVAVQADGSDTAPYLTVANDASDYTTAVQWPIDGCSGDLTSLAKSTNATIAMDVRVLQNVRFLASSAGSSDTTLTYYWGVR